MVKEFNAFISLTSAQQSVSINIPRDIDINQSKFAIVCVGGTVSPTSLIHIHCPTIQSPYVLSTASYKSDVIAFCVLGPNASMSQRAEKSEVGQTLKVGSHNPNFEFYITDADYALFSGDIAIEFQLCVFEDLE